MLRPDLDGKVGRVSVLRGDAAIQLEQANAAAEVTADGNLRPAEVTEDEVNKIFGEALAALPIAPRSFTLHFELGAVDLTPDSRPLLEELRAEIQRRSVAEVVVIGHTDRKGSDASNDQLSLRRAYTIRDWLIEQGIPRAAISTAGRGEREPLVPTEDEVEEVRNRRVEIRIR